MESDYYREEDTGFLSPVRSSQSVSYNANKGESESAQSRVKQILEED